jgi:hypothetical protein
VTRLVHGAGVSPVQASPERVVHVDLLESAYVVDESARVISSGSSVVIASLAGHMGPGLPCRS